MRSSETLHEYSEAVILQMLRIDRDILNIDQVICSNIDLIDFENVTRAYAMPVSISRRRSLPTSTIHPEENSTGN